MADSESQEVKRKGKGKLREERTKGGRSRGKMEKRSLLSGREWNRLRSWSCCRGLTSPTSSLPDECLCVRVWVCVFVCVLGACWTLQSLRATLYQQHVVFCSLDFAFNHSHTFFVFSLSGLHTHTLTLSRRPSTLLLFHSHKSTDEECLLKKRPTTCSSVIFVVQKC